MLPKENLDILCGLLISMTQYRPSDRPSAMDVRTLIGLNGAHH